VSTLDLIRLRRSEVASAWVELTLATYPEASARFFAAERDAFRNPVGAVVRRAVPSLLDGVLGDAAEEKVLEALDAVVRLRAVQDFSAGQAVGFVLLLKRAIRRVLGDELSSCPTAEAREVEERVDALTLQAVDILAACRQRLFELRTGEAKARVHSLLKRAGMLCELDEEGDGDPAVTKGGCSP